MELWTAFLLGFAGSAHCAGMCGPLALALPAGSGGHAGLFAGRMLYNLGRIVTYASVGAVFGLLGHAFAIAGLQRWVSIIAGLAILLGLFLSPRFTVFGPVVRAVGRLKSAMGTLLRWRGSASMFSIGLLNGLLPCGLVYAACGTALTRGGAVSAAAYMAVFGLGTFPAMLALSLAGHKLQFTWRLKMQRLVPVSMALVGTLLILRGMDLGIPYLSPKLSDGPDAAACCHSH